MKTFYCLFLSGIVVLASCDQVRPDKFNKSYTGKRNLRSLMKESTEYNASNLINEALSDGVYTYSGVEIIQNEDFKPLVLHPSLRCVFEKWDATYQCR